MKKILIISGWIGNRKIFSPIIDKLQGSDIRFIDFQQIDNKESIVVKVNESIKEFNPDIVIAWSMGTLALLKALEEKVVKSKLVLIAPTSKFTKNEHNSFGWISRVVDSMIKSLKTSKELTLEKFCNNMLTKNEMKYKSLVIDNLELGDLLIDSSTLSNGLLFLRDVEASNIDKIENETLIIHGEEDFICSVHGAEYINKKLKNSTLKVIDNCGHIPFITSKKEFINILYNFLGDINND
ncbi:alpha/beta hydrolase [Clostridium cylindrosporum]|uniref:Biotin biosynthesis protein BioH n=1 Tax=Clostridium cylindrosporum DSM 605 TaxID=1121307 RepID=A0A0J8D514_CLOCY|nr:alpha/beta hydrolase [Clostridium cylindrosporum]KMT20907.1 biotin biosynthesis protein BioH [Clostridium cylindrosporum DSM 605]